MLKSVFDQEGLVSGDAYLMNLDFMEQADEGKAAAAEDDDDDEDGYDDDEHSEDSDDSEDDKNKKATLARVPR